MAKKQTTIKQAPTPERTYRWRTDAASGTVEAASPELACDRLWRQSEWAKIGGDGEASDIADGAWLLITDEDGVEIMRRGNVPT